MITNHDHHLQIKSYCHWKTLRSLLFYDIPTIPTPYQHTMDAERLLKCEVSTRPLRTPPGCLYLRSQPRLEIGTTLGAKKEARSSIYWKSMQRIISNENEREISGKRGGVLV